MTLLLKFYSVLYTPTPTLGYTRKSIINVRKMLALHSYQHEYKLDPFVRLVPKLFCRTQRAMTVYACL